MKEQLEKIKEEALKKIEASDALEKLNDIRVSYLGKKGELTSLLKSMKDVSPEERPKVGQMVNDARAIIEARLEETKNVLARKAREEQLKKETEVHFVTEAGWPYMRYILVKNGKEDNKRRGSP